MHAQDLARQLGTVVGTFFDEAVEVGDLTRLPGGASRETWSFSVRRARWRDEAPRPAARDPPGAPVSGLGLEAGLLQAAGRAGVPVPRVIVAGDQSDGLGAAFIVMEFVEGETIPRRILRDEALAEVRPRLAGQCGLVLAALHRIPPAEVPGLAGGDALERLRGLLDRLGQPHPRLRAGDALAGRDSSRQRSGEAVVHGDFRNGNLIVGVEGIRAVLDWELAHLGTPSRTSAGCVSRRGASARPCRWVGSARSTNWSPRTGAGGGPVDGASLHWWLTLGTLRWGIICIVQALTHTSGALRSVELAAVGRRVCEVEWDLLELLP